MILHFINFIKRSVYRNKFFYLINVLGLSLGISCSVLLFILAQYWSDYDTFHNNAENIYRVVNISTKDEDIEIHNPGVPVPFLEAFKLELPNVKKFTFVSYPAGKEIVLQVQSDGETKLFSEARGLVYTNESFFKVFDRDLLAGNAETALKEPNQIILSENMVRKYFGDLSYDKVIGKPVVMNESLDLIVSGVATNYPSNTNFPFDIFVSYSSIQQKKEQTASWNSVNGNDQFYIVLPDNQSVEGTNKSLERLGQKYHGTENKIAYFLQPLLEMNFDSRFEVFGERTVNKEVLLVLRLIAAFILLVACINYINLATSVSTKRSKEIGIRKVLGSSKKMILIQIFSETCLVVTVSALIAFILVFIFLPTMNSMTGIEISGAILRDYKILVTIFAVVLVTILLAGFYPSSILSNLPPIQNFKAGGVQASRFGNVFRKGLMTFQLVVTMTFIISVIVVYKQLSFIQKSDLGFDRKDLVFFRLPPTALSKMKALKSELLKLHLVENVTLSFSPPFSDHTYISDFMLGGGSGVYNAQVKNIDVDYLATFKIALLEGSNITESDSFPTAAVVNEAFVKKVGENPQDLVGQSIVLWRHNVVIVGVVKDFHTQSFKAHIQPTILYNGGQDYLMMTVKMKPQQDGSYKKDIENVWRQFYPNHPINCLSFDEEIASFYNTEKSIFYFLSVAALITILISCMGVYSLIAFIVSTRQKELVIRKLFGATLIQNLSYITGGILSLVAIAFVFSVLITQPLLNQWLNNFEYRIQVKLIYFLYGGSLTLLITMLAISYKSYKAIQARPIDILRQE